MRYSLNDATCDERLANNSTVISKKVRTNIIVFSLLRRRIAQRAMQTPQLH